MLSDLLNAFLTPAQQQFLRYGMVGGVNTLFGVSCMWALAQTGLPYPVYTGFTYALSFILSYTLNRLFTFKTGASWQHFIRFALVNVVNMLLVQALQIIWIEGLRIHEPVAVGMGMVAYFLVGFWANKYLVFSPVPWRVLAQRYRPAALVVLARQWLGAIGETLPAAEERRLLMLALKLFIVSRVIFIALGVHFNDDALFHSMHLPDSELLKTEPFTTLWYSHIQPPLFGAFTALAFALTPNGYEWVLLWPLFLALGWLMLLGIYRLQRHFAVPVRLGITLAVLFALSPGAVYYESWYGYAHLGAVALLWSAVWFGTWLTTRRSLHLSLALLLLVLPAGLHSLFLPWWGVLACGALVVFARGYRWQVLACSLLPLALILSFPIKNYMNYGIMASSSWDALTAQILVNVNHPDPVIRQQLLAEGRLTPLILHSSATMDPRQIPPHYFPTHNTGIAVLDTIYKANGNINYNAAVQLNVRPELIKNALATLHANPAAYTSTVQNALFFFLLPQADYLWIPGKTLTFYYDWAWNLITTGRLGWSPRPVFHTLVAKYGGYESSMAPSFWGTLWRSPPWLIGWFNLITLPFLIGMALWLALCSVLPNAAQPDKQRLMRLWVGYHIAYITAVSVLLAITENQRYRFYLSPLLVVYVAFCVQWALARWPWLGLNAPVTAGKPKRRAAQKRRLS